MYSWWLARCNEQQILYCYFCTLRVAFVMLTRCLLSLLCCFVLFMLVCWESMCALVCALVCVCVCVCVCVNLCELYFFALCALLVCVECFLSFLQKRVLGALSRASFMVLLFWLCCCELSFVVLVCVRARARVCVCVPFSNTRSQFISDALTCNCRDLF